MTDDHEKTLGQVLRYGLVGVVSNLIGYAAYLLLTAFVLPPKLAMTLLYAVGAAVGFFGNRHFTFRHRGSVSRAAIAYVIVHGIGWALNFLLLYTFSDRLGYPHQLIQAVAVLLVAAYVFVSMRRFVFPVQQEEKGSRE
ncbi:GtrA family protein [uncultured Roseobacter sp.]|uniref:GtrA family protein n=1 Tax=uncultured Roseobacter sp. TaxID=114847 RepID=UPI00262394E8|nr:GtrA family protein [uncultured Roseobacter sp.]